MSPELVTLGWNSGGLGSTDRSRGASHPPGAALAPLPGSGPHSCCSHRASSRAVPAQTSLEKQLGQGTDGLCSAWHLPESGLVLNLPVKDKSSPDLAQLSPD